MDYECDYGYIRPDLKSGQCIFDTKLDEAAWKVEVSKMQDESCEELGYYQVTQGYRKIPGNICTNGVQLEP